MRYNSSRQEMIDKIMCKPGYTWNETLQRCLGYAGTANPAVGKKPKVKKPTANNSVGKGVASNPAPAKPIAKAANSTDANMAVAKEVQLRASSEGL